MKKSSNYDGNILIGPQGERWGSWRRGRDRQIAKPKQPTQKLPGIRKWTPRSRKPPKSI